MCRTVAALFMSITRKCQKMDLTSSSVHVDRHIFHYTLVVNNLAFYLITLSTDNASPETVYERIGY